MSDDLLSELTLIDLSRVQRAALERWVPILLTAGATDLAEEIRHELNATGQDERIAA